MFEMLAEASCRLGLTTGFAEVRRLVDGKGIMLNGQYAKAWDQIVMSGDVIQVGKHKVAVV